MSQIACSILFASESKSDPARIGDSPVLLRKAFVQERVPDGSRSALRRNYPLISVTVGLVIAGGGAEPVDNAVRSHAPVENSCSGIRSAARAEIGSEDGRSRHRQLREPVRRGGGRGRAGGRAAWTR